MNIEVATRWFGYLGIGVGIGMIIHFGSLIFLLWHQRRQARQSINNYIKSIQNNRRAAEELEAMMAFDEMLEQKVNVRPEPGMWN